MRRILGLGLVAACALSTSPAVAADGDVEVKQKGNWLVVTGDDGANHVRIASVDSDVVVTGLDGTTVNGGESAVYPGSAFKSLKVRLKDGEDRLELSELTLAGDCVVKLGSGDDVLDVDDVVVADDLRVKCGDGDDRADIDTVEVGDKMKFNYGQGGGYLIASGLECFGSARFLCSESPDLTELWYARFHKKVVADTKGGDDAFGFRDLSKIYGTVRIELGDGDDEVKMTEMWVSPDADVHFDGESGDDDWYSELLSGAGLGQVDYDDFETVDL